MRLRREDLIDSDGEIVRALRIKMEKTDKWIERALRDDTREAIKTYLGTRMDAYPWLFISRSRRTKFHTPGSLTRSAVHLVIKRWP